MYYVLQVLHTLENVSPKASLYTYTFEHTISNTIHSITHTPKILYRTWLHTTLYNVTTAARNQTLIVALLCYIQTYHQKLFSLMCRIAALVWNQTLIITLTTTIHARKILYRNRLHTAP